MWKLFWTHRQRWVASWACSNTIVIQYLYQSIYSICFQLWTEMVWLWDSVRVETGPTHDMINKPFVPKVAPNFDQGAVSQWPLVLLTFAVLQFNVKSWTGIKPLLFIESLTVLVWGMDHCQPTVVSPTVQTCSIHALVSYDTRPKKGFLIRGVISIQKFQRPRLSNPVAVSIIYAGNSILFRKFDTFIIGPEV